MPIEGPWQVEFRPMAGAPFKRELDKLVDFGRSEDATLHTFSGTVVYRKKLERGIQPGARWLDLGTVHGVSTLHANGARLGVRWWGRHRYALPALGRGPIDIEIRVTTTAANHARSLDEPTARHWTRAWKDKTPAKTGLLGPVRLMR